jgi:cytochrome c oxidase subunit IV
MTDETEPLPPSDPASSAGATVLTGEQAPPPAEPPVEPAADHGAAHPAAGEHGAHPTDVQYMLIALGLAVLTGIEVAISYAKGLGDASNPLLIILAATKFAIVVGFFMHLRFERPIVRRIFIVGIILALTVYLIVFFTLGVFTGTHGHHG